MSCKLPPPVREYVEHVESGQHRSCPEQHALCRYIQKVFDTEDLFFDAEQFEKYLRLERYFPFNLMPWEKFLICLTDCVYQQDGTPRWRTLFNMVGRGAGKDGLIAFDSFCMTSPYNPIMRYNVDICANNEEQAMTPLKDIVDVLETPASEEKLKRYYYHTKELIQGRRNKGIVRGRTNNPKGRDGMRSGKVVFNEVHAFQNYDNIKVFVSGLGKVAQPRIAIHTSNGDVTDGPLDDYLARAQRILFEGESDEGFLPFICRLSTREQVDDEENWYMANPSLAYFPNLLTEIRDEYREWKLHPEQNGDFLTKRMGLRAGAKEISVTDYANVQRTNRPLPDLSGLPCVVGIDYAELSDWAAVNTHFRIGDQRFDLNHAWMCLNSRDLPRLKIPWKEWADKGCLTVVDDITIHPDLLTNYIRQLSMSYHIKMLALDHFRWTLVSSSLQNIGFDAKDRQRVKLIRPSDIMQVEPVIQDCFERDLFTWGDVPALRWAVNNTKRVRASRTTGSDTGNFYYAKIEAKSRKTDPFMALVASMCAEPALGTGAAPAPPPVGAIVF